MASKATLTWKACFEARFHIIGYTDQLKNISPIEHTRHRSLANFRVNLVCGLIAYTYLATKEAFAVEWAEQEQNVVCISLNKTQVKIGKAAEIKKHLPEYPSKRLLYMVGRIGFEPMTT